MSQHSSSFFNLVEVTLNGLCPIFHWTVFLSCENFPVFQLFVRYSQKQFAKLWVYLGVRTCEVFLCFVTIMFVLSIVLTSLFSVLRHL